MVERLLLREVCQDGFEPRLCMENFEKGGGLDVAGHVRFGDVH